MRDETNGERAGKEGTGTEIESAGEWVSHIQQGGHIYIFLVFLLGLEKYGGKQIKKKKLLGVEKLHCETGRKGASRANKTNGVKIV